MAMSVTGMGGGGQFQSPPKKFCSSFITYSLSVVDSKNKQAGGHSANFTPLKDGWTKTYCRMFFLLVLPTDLMVATFVKSPVPLSAGWVETCKENSS
jgi:hypothetical protein